MSVENTSTKYAQIKKETSIQTDEVESQETPIDSGDATLERVMTDHLDRLSKDSRRVAFRLTVMGILFIVGVVLAPESVTSAVVGYYLLAVYAGWRFLNGFKPASRVIELFSKVVTMINGLFIPDWAASVLEKATTVAMKIGVSLVLGVVIAPVEIGRNVYELIQLRGLRRDVIEARI